MAEHSQFKLFAQRRFMPFFVTQGLGAFNDNVFKNGLAALLVFNSSRLAGLNTDQVVNLSALLFILPFFLFSALFGQVADKYEKSMQIRRIKLFEVGIMLLATVGFWLNSITLLLAVLFLLGLQSAMFGPIKYGIIPQVLTNRELIGGNALVEMGTFVAILAGTIAGPLLIGIEADWPVWASGAALATAAAGYAASLGIPAAPAVDADLRIRWNFFSETVRNIRFLGRDRTMLTGVLGISWFWFFGATFLVQVPSYSENVIGGDERLMSTLLATFIIGISTGSLLCERMSGGKVEIGLVPLGALGLSLFGVDMYFASPAGPSPGLSLSAFLSVPANWRIVFDLVMIGVFGGFYIVPLYALVQQRSDPARRSRVIAGNNILNALFMVIAAIFAMLLLGRAGFSIPDLFLATAVLNLVVASFVFTAVPDFVPRFLAWLVTHGGYRVRASGLDNVPAEGAVIVAVNDVGAAGPMIIGNLSRRPLKSVVPGDQAGNPFVRFMAEVSGVARATASGEGARLEGKAAERLRLAMLDGDALAVFITGNDTKRVSDIAAEVLPGRRFTVVPAGIRVKSRGNGRKRKWLPHRTAADVRFGQPLDAGESQAGRLAAVIGHLAGEPD